MRTQIQTPIHDDKNLDDYWWGLQGLDTRNAPFSFPGAPILVYKNLIRDASGRYNGYIIVNTKTHEHAVVVTVAEAAEQLSPFQ